MKQVWNWNLVRLNGYKKQKFLSFSDSPVKEKKKIPTEYRAYLEKCWDKARKNQIRAWQELGSKVIVFHER